VTALGATRSASSSEATVSIHVVREIVHTAERAGVARDALLRAIEVAPEQLGASDARITREQLHRVSERAVELSDDPAFGLHWCEQLQESAFAPISHLMSHSCTLRDAFDSLLRFQALLSDDIGFTLEERDREVIVHCKSIASESLVVQRFVSEMIVAGLFRLIRFFNPLAMIGRASFTYPTPDYHAEYERMFGGIERFGQSFTGIVFDPALMGAPSPSRDEDLHIALHAIAEQRVLRLLRGTPYAMRVRDVLLKKTRPQRCDMAEIARELGLSPRTLRRRLGDEGKPFGTLVNEACAVVAKHMLASSEASVQEVAYDIGFSDPAAFNRAFKRWTGMTPSAFRQAQRHSNAR
jgi:AraC-like DNA-binding protein